eukprot:425096_1
MAVELFFIVLVTIFFNMCRCCQNGTMIYSSGKRYSTNVTQCIYPSNEQEIINLINIAQQSNSSIRATGKSHSRSAANMMMQKQNTKDLIMINMSEYMNNIIEFNQNEKTLTFEAGLSIYGVVSELEQYNLSLYNKGLEPLYTNFVGSMMTGSHGMGSMKNSGGTIASNVVNLRMILANGTIINANNTFNKDIFDATRISFGSFGIITQITVKSKPIFYVTSYPRIDIYGINNTEIVTNLVINNLTTFVNDNDYILTSFYVFEQRFQFAFKNIFNDSNPSNKSCWLPDSTPICTDIYYKALNPDPINSWDATRPWRNIGEAVMYIDAELWQDAFIGVSDWIFQQKKHKTKLWVDAETYYNDNEDNIGEIEFNIRFVGEDDIWLSPAFNRTVVQIGFHFHHIEWEQQDKWTNAIREYLQNTFGLVTYHWGKQIMATYCDL